MTSCWIVTEKGLTGTLNQCLGVADALGVKAQIKEIGLCQPWTTFSPLLGFESAASFTGDKLEAPWPDILIAGGRKAIAAARYVKKASGGKTFTVFLQDPRISPKAFDLVALPAHDPTRGDNVLVTTGAANRITPERLAAERRAWEKTFLRLPNPRVAVLIGGNSKAYKMTPAITRNLATQLKELDASLMITTSRRTGKENEAILKDTLRDKQNTFFWDGSGDNPYFGMLAWADFILVTNDSASMLSEAATTGKPVYMIPLEGHSKRFDILHKNLIEKGCIRRFDGKLERWDYEPLNDAALIAQKIKRTI